MAKYWGWNLPFWDARGVLLRQEDLRLVKNDLLQLLLTMPGERIHRPDWGCPLRGALFELASADELQRIEEQTVAAIAEHEPRISNVNVLLEPDLDKNLLKVTVSGTLVADPSVKLDLETVLQ